jgi:hypothetical protein
MPGTIGPDPFPLAPDKGHGVRGDLRSTANRRQRALGYGRIAVDKWLGERSFTEGRATIYERRRRGEWAAGLTHPRLHAP